MKKKVIAALTIAASLSLFAACSVSSSAAPQSNWLKDTAPKKIPVNFSETLQYAVSYQKSATAEKGAFHIEYSDGSYVTRFEGVYEESAYIYSYSTEFSVKVRYTYNDETQEFTDSFTSSVKFYDLENELKPISSCRRIRYTAPSVAPSYSLKSLSDGFKQYNMQTEISYGEKQADVKMTYYKIENGAYTDEAEGDTEEKKISAKNDGSLFDNEQLFPLLRAHDLSSGLSFRSIDLSTLSAEKISTSDYTALEYKEAFTMNGNPVSATIAANQIKIKYSKQNSGPQQTFVLAKTTAADNNIYRNVVLKCEAPVIYSHGTLIYTLKDATFFQA